MNFEYQNFTIRDWQDSDRAHTADAIRTILQEYGLPWQPEEADRDAIEVEEFYLNKGGEFWVVERQGRIVGTAAYYPSERGVQAVEIRKMYLLSSARGRGLGKYLLQQLEQAISARGFQEIWLETASVLKEAVRLYETSGYQAATGVQTKRCDRIYVKSLVSRKKDI
jgi:putative acetyltransferase